MELEKNFLINQTRTIFTEIARFVKVNRIRKGLSVRELSKLTGIDSGHISNIENNKVKCSNGYYSKLFKVLAPKTRKERTENNE